MIFREDCLAPAAINDEDTRGGVTLPITGIPWCGPCGCDGGPPECRKTPVYRYQLLNVADLGVRIDASMPVVLGNEVTVSVDPQYFGTKKHISGVIKHQHTKGLARTGIRYPIKNVH